MLVCHIVSIFCTYDCVCVYLCAPHTDPPLPPMHVTGNTINNNSTAINIMWSAPSAPPSPIKNYIVSYIIPNGTELVVIVPPSKHNLLVGGLSPGQTYIFGVQVLYTDGTVSASVNVTVTLMQNEGFFTTTWFYVALSGGVVFFLLVVCICVACIFCHKCCNRATGMCCNVVAYIITLILVTYTLSMPSRSP